MDILQNLKANVSRSVERESYTLNMVLGIIAMFNEGLKVGQVSELTGRSINSLRYKFLEGEIELNGKKQIRSVKRFANVQEIYAHFKTEYTGEADVAARIAEFKASLTAKVAQAPKAKTQKTA